MKLRFTANILFPSYIGAVTFTKDGEVKEVPDAAALRMLRDWPENFSRVEEPPDPPAQETRIAKPAHKRGR